MKEAVVTIRRKDLDKFYGQSKGYTGWFNLDSEFLKICFSTIKLDFYKNIYENDIEGQDMEPYETFFVPFDSTKLNLNNINNPVKNRASSSERKKKQRRKLWHQSVVKSHYLNNLSGQKG